MGCSQSTEAGGAVVAGSSPSKPPNPKSTSGAPSSAVEKVKSSPPETRNSEATVTFDAAAAKKEPPADRSEKAKLEYTTETASTGYTPGYSSGATTPAAGSMSDDSSVHSGSSGPRERTGSLSKLPKPTLVHSTSAIGLDDMIESRKGAGDLKSNVVHIEVPFGKPIEEVYDGVHTGPVLGSGISGLVRLVTHKTTGIKYAVKCLDLGLVETDEGLQQLREEIFIMCQLDHPNIVRLEEVYESHSEIYLVQELCLGGELFDRLDEQPDYHYTEAQCARLVKQMLCAVRYLHSKGIIHRDLKLENFLFSSTSPDSELRMIDFGLSKHFKFGEVHHEAVGTPYTVAPEVIRGSYDEKCDIWAIGVIAFLLLSGDPPFGGCGGPEPLLTVRTNILKGSYNFEPLDIWATVSPQAREFIKSLLVTNPQKRPTAKEVQKHQWLREWSHRDRTEDDNRLNPNVVKALVSFKEFSDMRKLLCEVLSFTLLPEQIKDLRKEFEKMDTDGSGEISLEALKQVLIENAGAGSLGGLTEEEVEDIFNAMRVRKSEKRIHWHEFIAAGISQCQVDERNLRLAFDRLDSDHKGYITLENVMDLMGNDAAESEEAMQEMWGDSMKAVNCEHARITYDDFLLLMKGQTKDAELEGSFSDLGHLQSSGQPLHVLHEVHELKSEDGLSMEEEQPGSGVIVLPSGDKVNIENGAILEMPVGATFDSPGKNHPASAPVTPMYNRRLIDMDDDLDTPLSMDEDDDLDLMISNAADQRVSMLGIGGPPLSGRSPSHSPIPLTPRSDRLIVPPSLPEGQGVTIPLLAGPTSSPREPYASKRRSRSFDQQEVAQVQEDFNEPQFEADSRRVLLLPEHMHNKNGIDSLIKDETKTPLVVNRTLYRAHRQMRLAVLEASKRFEEEQARRARDILMAKSEAEGPAKEDGVGMIGAGLVMRHGHTKQVSSESVRNFLMQNKAQQQKEIEKATTRGGRGRRNRKKTISDMSGMLAAGGLDSEEISKAAEASKDDVSPPKLEASVTAPVPDARGHSDGALAHDLDIDDIIQATVPGQFRKTKDPFAEGGRYGAFDQQSMFGAFDKNVSSSLGSEPTPRNFGTIDSVFGSKTDGRTAKPDGSTGDQS